MAVDDASRLAYVAVLPDQRGSTAARFYAEQGIRIERVPSLRSGQALTDRAFAFTNAKAFAAAVQTLGARHKLTRPCRPQTNGKAERFIRTLLDERLAALPRWLRFYNERRPHPSRREGLLGGRPPLSAVNNVRGNYT